jgi:D-alanyl-D-alanine carboxypeptidase
MLAALGFFIFSSCVVFGGTHTLLQQPAIPMGAKADSQAAVATKDVQVEPTPNLASPMLAAPESAHAPEWHMVGSKAIPEAPVAATAGLVIDDKTGEVLAAKNADWSLPMASITKLMTAWVALDRAKPDHPVTVSATAAATPPTHMPLGEGEVLNVQDLLSMLLLTSANDAAQALADGLGGESSFIQGMNEKASKLGLKNTHFANPTGFDADGHHSSANDLAILAHHLFIKHPELLPLMQQSKVIIGSSDKHKAYDVANFHQLVGVYPGFLGGKPGFTGNAGNCLLTLAERDGKKVLAVVLNSPDPAGESTKLLDMGFELAK